MIMLMLPNKLADSELLENRKAKKKKRNENKEKNKTSSKNPFHLYDKQQRAQNVLMAGLSIFSMKIRIH